jgi:hypothetical protein
LTDEERAIIETACNRATEWLDASKVDSDIHECSAQRKKLEDEIGPILEKLYAGTGMGRSGPGTASTPTPFETAFAGFNSGPNVDVDEELD